MSSLLIKTDQEKNICVSHTQNKGQSLNIHNFKPGILHEKLNISKPAVISYTDFLDLILPLSQNSEARNDDFDKQISQFVEDWEQNVNSSRSILNATTTGEEDSFKISTSLSKKNVSNSSEKIESKTNKTNNKDIVDEKEEKNMDITNGKIDQVNGRKISTNSQINGDLCQETFYENILNRENISVFCKKINRNRMHLNEYETNIHISVIDCESSFKKDFLFAKDLLLEKMGIFSEITNTKYTIKDIIVKCNMNIFGWIIHWMKEDSDYTKPVISYYNVIPILIAANVFKINALVDQCMIFIRLYINNIVEANQDFSNIDSQLLVKITEQFSNSEVEDIVDEEDKLQSTLYCNLILFLANQKNEKKFKHFSSLKNIFCCKFCHKILPIDRCLNVVCRSDCNIVTITGKVKGLHKRDKTWSLTSHIKMVYEKLHSWRLVYWQLWGSCHFLFCSICQSLYPLYQASWCPFHPGKMEYFNLDENEGTITLPIGRYECCGQRVYMYECIKNPNCCSYKNHVPVLKSPSEIEIHNLFLKHKQLILLQPPELDFPESLTQLVRAHDTSEKNASTKTHMNSFWWHGIQLIPKNFKHPGPLIPRFWERNPLPKSNKSKTEKTENEINSYSNNFNIFVPFSQAPTVQFIKGYTFGMKEKFKINNNSILYSDSKKLSKDSSLNLSKLKDSQVLDRKKKRSDEICTCSSQALVLWNTEQVVRFNQDNQRDYEEWTFSKIISNLTSTYYGTKVPATIFQPSGGSYFRLEFEWQEKHKKIFKKLEKRAIRNASFFY